jgi:hypothetical protein
VLQQRATGSGNQRAVVAFWPAVFFSPFLTEKARKPHAIGEEI